MIGKILNNAYRSGLNSYCVWNFYFKLTFLLYTKSFSDCSKNLHQLFSVTQNSFGFALLDSNAFCIGKLIIIGMKAFDCYIPTFCLVPFSTGRSPPYRSS